MSPPPSSFLFSLLRTFLELLFWPLICSRGRLFLRQCCYVASVASLGEGLFRAFEVFFVGFVAILVAVDSAQRYYWISLSYTFIIS
jgi:hypothetical protein